MYKWPHGRVIRIVCLILILLVAGDLGYNGAYAKIFAAVTNRAATDHVQQLIIGGVFAAVTLAVALGGLVLVGFHHRAVDFLINVEHEMKVVEWPAFNQLLYSTVIISITMALVGGLILGVDVVTHWLLFKELFAEGG
jgi:preprotein translocase SecE subunit